ncbi:hypothetical protein ACQVP2_20135 [Methylobacterium aquaticum]|uniref:hypothetical protein n=1 Tax=Methylobacterium aquaticum TaxID=270351 RepID=UPI003D185112
MAGSESLFRLKHGNGTPLPKGCENRERSVGRLRGLVRQRAGDRVRIGRDGDRLILGPVGKKDLLAILATREPIKDDDPDVDEMLPPLETDRS